MHFKIGHISYDTHFNSLGKRIHRMKHVYHLNIIFILKKGLDSHVNFSLY